MNDATCQVVDCTRVRRGAHGYCKKHYERNRVYGSPVGPSQEERFWSKVDKSGDCWEWTACRQPKGYGLFQKRTAHRVAYELTHGPVSPDLLVDHICHNRGCVNPEHLRLATPKQNRENRSGNQANNRSGVHGVNWHRGLGKWVARVVHNETKYHLGYFDDLAEAERAVTAKRNELFTFNDVDRVADDAA